MEALKINGKTYSLVDQVEEKLIRYFKENGLRPGSQIPSEYELAESLGVARSVLREALSRLKMSGMIVSRTRRGMTLAEPSLLGGMRRVVNPLLMTDETLMDLLGFRVALEIGCSQMLFDNITPADIEELEAIVAAGGDVTENNEYSSSSEFSFHTKLYQITNNKTIGEFQLIMHPVMDFVKDRFRDYFEPIALRLKESGELVSHRMLLDCIKNGDQAAYEVAIKRHFKIYTDYLKERNG